MRQHPKRYDHHAADERRRCGKAHDGDECDPQRRKDNAADAGAVVGRRQRRGPPPIEPGGNHHVDGECAGASPANAAEHGRDEKLPRCLRIGPAGNAEGDANRTGLGDGRDPEPPVDRRHIGNAQGAHQKMRGHGGRHEANRPAARVLQRVQENRRSVESHAPAKNGNDEGRPHDAPAKEWAGSSVDVGRRHVAGPDSDGAKPGSILGRNSTAMLRLRPKFAHY